MAFGRMRHEWDIFAPITAILLNRYLPKGRPPYNVWDIHPYRKRSDYET